MMESYNRGLRPLGQASKVGLPVFDCMKPNRLWISPILCPEGYTSNGSGIKNRK